MYIFRLIAITSFLLKHWSVISIDGKHVPLRSNILWPTDVFYLKKEVVLDAVQRFVKMKEN